MSQGSTADVFERTPKKVYVCHAYSGAGTIEDNINQIKIYCRSICGQGDIPIAPQLFLGSIYDEDTQRDQAMSACMKILRDCDRVEVFGKYLTRGMIQEIAYASKLKIPIVSYGTLFLSLKGDSSE